MGNFKTYKITLGRVYNIDTGEICRKPSVRLVGNTDVALNCLDDKKGIYEIQVGPNDENPCLSFEVKCDDCSKCPVQIITKCFCSDNDGCDDCSVCGDNGICEDKCPNKCDDGLCVDCIDDDCCPDNQTCANGKCNCPTDRPFQTENGCLECIDDNDCTRSGEICVSGTCEPIECSNGHYSDQLGECVECINSGHCGENETCINNTCDCSSGYIRVDGVCIEGPDCTFDTDCGDCQYCLNGSCTEQICPQGTICENGTCIDDECFAPDNDCILEWEFVPGDIQQSGQRGNLSGNVLISDIDVFQFSDDKRFTFSINGNMLPGGGQWSYSESASQGFAPINGTNNSVVLENGDGILGTNYLGFYLRYTASDGRQIIFEVQNNTFNATSTDWVWDTLGLYDPTGTITGDYGFLKLKPCPNSGYSFQDPALADPIITANILEGDLSVSFTELLPDGCLRASITGCGSWQGELNLTCRDNNLILETEILNIDWTCCDRPLSPECISTGEPCDKEPCTVNVEISSIDGTQFHVAPVYSDCVTTFSELYTLSNPVFISDGDVVVQEQSSHAIITYTDGGCVTFRGDTVCLLLEGQECVDECANMDLPPNILTFDNTNDTFTFTANVGSDATLHPSIILTINGVQCSPAEYTISGSTLTLNKPGQPEVTNTVVITMDNGCDGAAQDTTSFAGVIPCVENVSNPLINCTVSNEFLNVTVNFGQATNADVLFNNISVFNNGGLTGESWFYQYPLSNIGSEGLLVEATAQGSCLIGLYSSHSCPDCQPQSEEPTVDFITYDDGTISFTVNDNGSTITQVSIDDVPTIINGDQFGPILVDDDGIVICVRYINECGIPGEVCVNSECSNSGNVLTSSTDIESCEFTLALENPSTLTISDISGSSFRYHNNLILTNGCTGKSTVLQPPSDGFPGTGLGSCPILLIGFGLTCLGNLNNTFEFTNGTPTLDGTYDISNINGCGTPVPTFSCDIDRVCFTNACNNLIIEDNTDSTGFNVADDFLTGNNCYYRYPVRVGEPPAVFSSVFAKVRATSECDNCLVNSDNACINSVSDITFGNNLPNISLVAYVHGDASVEHYNPTTDTWDPTTFALDMSFGNSFPTYNFTPPAGIVGADQIFYFRIVDQAGDCECVRLAKQFTYTASGTWTQGPEPLAIESCATDPGTDCDTTVTNATRSTNNCSTTIVTTNIKLTRIGNQTTQGGFNFSDEIEYTFEVGDKCNGVTSTQVVTREVAINYSACATFEPSNGDYPSSLTGLVGSNQSVHTIDLSQNTPPIYGTTSTGALYGFNLRAYLQNVINNTPFNINANYHAEVRVCHDDSSGSDVYTICFAPFSIDSTNFLGKNCWIGWESGDANSFITVSNNASPDRNVSSNSKALLVNGQCNGSMLPSFLADITLTGCDGESYTFQYPVPASQVDDSTLDRLNIDNCDVTIDQGFGGQAWTMDLRSDSFPPNRDVFCVSRTYSISSTCADAQYTFFEQTGPNSFTTVQEPSTLNSNTYTVDNGFGVRAVVVCPSTDCVYVINPEDWTIL